MKKIKYENIFILLALAFIVYICLYVEFKDFYEFMCVMALISTVPTMLYVYIKSVRINGLVKTFKGLL